MNQKEQSIIEHRGPFQVTNREVMHDKYGMQLIGDEVIRPDGTVGEQYWINFPRQAVLVFPIDSEGNLHLTKEFTYATNQYMIEAVGGGIEEGENVYTAVEREAREELGLEVDSVGYLGAYQSITSRVNNVSHLFLARIVNEHQSNLEPDEDIHAVIVPFTQAYEMALFGNISNPTIAFSILKIKAFFEALQNFPKLPNQEVTP